MTVQLPLVLLLLAVTIALVRQSDLRLGHAVVCTLFGFYLADSSLGPVVARITEQAVGLVEQFNF